MTTIPVSELMRTLEAEGEAALARHGQGPFLLEIPTQDPAGIVDRSQQAQASTSARTQRFDEGLLLDLKRTRGAEDARLWRIEEGTTIGRASSCAVQLEGEESVSKEHARFERRDGAWCLLDLGSTNGTFVERERLAPGAPRALGELVSVQTGSRRFAFIPREDLLALLTPVRAVAAIPVERLRFELETLGSRRFLLRHSSPYLLVSEREEGEREDQPFRPRAAWPLLPPGPVTLGRTGQATITIRRGSVSKWHAKLSHAGEDRWTVEDTGSSNGTSVNGRRLEPGAPQRLNAWDALSFGPSVGGLFLGGRGLLEYLVDAEG
jgi:pSer/pThr/pTyr-binding forkhead associated (FHA) protein